MKTSILAYIHAGQYYSYSSSDFSGYKDFDSRKEADVFIAENDLKSLIGETIIDKSLDISLIYTKELTFNEHRTFFERIFNHGHSKVADIYYVSQREKENAKRQKQGFVYCKNNEDMTTEDYKGDLKESLTDYTMKYILSGGVFGYLGHSWRKLAHDKIIEQVVNKVKLSLDGEALNKWYILSVWLTSSDARHWMDSVEDTTNKEFKERFINNLSSIFSHGFVYSLEEHKGTAGSTRKLLAEYDGRLVVSE